MWGLLLELLVIRYYMGMPGSNDVLGVCSGCSRCSGILLSLGIRERGFHLV